LVSQISIQVHAVNAAALRRHHKEHVMPTAIIRKFKQEYGSAKGKRIFYATANKQDRNPETFRKRSHPVKNAKRPHAR
jgi:hypothetical protein